MDEAIRSGLIMFFQSGEFCKEFGHDYTNTIHYYNGTSVTCEKFICKFCKKEYGN